MKRFQRGQIDWTDFVFIGLVLCVLLVMGISAVGGERNKKEFMAACQEDGRKEYECIAMWRSGRR